MQRPNINRRPLPREDDELETIKKVSKVLLESLTAGVLFGVGWLGAFYLLKHKIPSIAK